MNKCGVRRKRGIIKIGGIGRLLLVLLGHISTKTSSFNINLKTMAVDKATMKVLSPLIVEFIGTFFLVMTIGLVVGEGSKGLAIPGALAPFAIGCVLMIMIFSGGHVSGAHFNPAVTFSIFLSGKFQLLTSFFDLV